MRVLQFVKVSTRRITTPGGTQEDKDENILHTIAREVKEEIGLKRKPRNYKPAGWVRVYKRYANQQVYVKNITYLFILEVDSTRLKVRDTKEMIKGRWVSIKRIPYSQMADYYQVWYPLILHGPICREVLLDETGTMIWFDDVEPDAEAWAPAAPLKKKAT